MVQTATHLPETTDDAEAMRLWLEDIAEHYDEDARRRIEQAAAMLLRCEGERMLETGESAVRHRLSGADILYRLRMDADTLCAALLHGCVGRAGIDDQALAGLAGPSLVRMTHDLRLIEHLTRVEYVAEGGKRADRSRLAHEENLRRMLLGIAEDVRVVLVVLADRLHLLRRSKHLSRERQLELAADTRRVYAPLANRLGIWQLKWELEDLALRAAEPEDYKRIAKALSERRDERQAYIGRVLGTLRAELTRAGIDGEVTGRPKHIYSIWKKMQRKAVDIGQIFDLRAVRILVEDIPACYTALGVVHGLWRHIPSEFDDYIATPKGNQYRSLHTAVIGPEDKPLEVQIRTRDMHEHAEYGVAAHWAYKEAKGLDADFQRRVVWMRNWLENAGDAEPNEDIVEQFKADLAPSNVYVLTPQAKVVELPHGATPLDFAYAIHSEIGHRCRGARVDGRMVPLSHRLASGETVEILTQKNAHPSRDWLSPHHGYLVTSRARNRVRQWFKQQDFDRNLTDGKAILERELTRLGIEATPQPEKLAERFNLRTGDDLLAAIGRGDVAVGQVARQVGEPRAERREAPDALPPARPQQQRPRPRPRQSTVIVEGIGDLMTRMASCCRPVPYDKLIGYLSVGRGVVVHRRNCREILNLPEAERDRLVDVTWAEQPAEAGYPVGLVLTAADRKGLLRDISSALADTDGNVLGSETQSDPTSDIAYLRFTVEVTDADHLDRIMTRLRQLPDMLSVERAH